MACEDCARRDSEEILDNLEHVERVQRNQGIAVMLILAALVFLFAALTEKGVLSYGDLLETARDG
jgi:hypothetical protein